MAMGECSAYSSLTADSKIKFAARHTSWWTPDTHWLSLRGPEWILAYGFAVYDCKILSQYLYRVIWSLWARIWFGYCLCGITMICLSIFFCSDSAKHVTTITHSGKDS